MSRFGLRSTRIEDIAGRAPRYNSETANSQARPRICACPIDMARHTRCRRVCPTRRPVIPVNGNELRRRLGALYSRLSCHGPLKTAVRHVNQSSVRVRRGSMTISQEWACRHRRFSDPASFGAS